MNDKQLFFCVINLVLCACGINLFADQIENTHLVLNPDYAYRQPELIKQNSEQLDTAMEDQVKEMALQEKYLQNLNNLKPQPLVAYASTLIELQPIEIASEDLQTRSDSKKLSESLYKRLKRKKKEKELLLTLSKIPKVLNPAYRSSMESPEKLELPKNINQVTSLNLDADKEIKKMTYKKKRWNRKRRIPLVLAPHHFADQKIKPANALQEKDGNA